MGNDVIDDQQPGNFTIYSLIRMTLSSLVIGKMNGKVFSISDSRIALIGMF